MENLKETLKVTLGQIGNHDLSGDIHNKSNGLSYNNPEFMRRKILKAIEVAKQDESDFLVLPEIMVPLEFVKSHIPSICNENNLIIIGGIEFHHKSTHNNKQYIQNEAFIAVPESSNGTITKEKAMVWRIPKLYPAFTEEETIQKAGYHFSPGNKLYIFNSEKYGSWAVLICVDFLNLPIHQILQKKVQTLFVVSFNKDLNYYYAMSESIHRILYCNVVVCNAANFGGSHAFIPYRKSYKREALKLYGNEIETTITVQLPLKKIKEIQQASRFEEFEGFAKKPSDYDYIR